MPNAEGPSILIVDDNAHDRELLKSLLEHGGYSVSVRSSGKAALAALEKTVFELMVLDLNMPDMDGFEVLRAVRRKLPQLNIVVISGFMPARLLEPARALGANAVLDKNLAADLLLPTVSNLLQKTK